MDDKQFNAASPAKKARMIIEAGAKARGQAAPQFDAPVEVEGDDTTALAARIIACGRKARRGRE